MLFTIIETDKPDSLALRMANRPAHLDYLRSLGDAVKAAGPFLDDKGDMMGGMVIIDVADRAAAETIVADDPFTHVGLAQSVEIRAWRWAMKNPEAP